nr:hypothetical protein BaRGS_017991 [Batillaria attramentaria]
MSGSHGVSSPPQHRRHRLHHLDDDNDLNNNESSPIVVRIHERLHKGRGSGSSPPLELNFDDEKRRGVVLDLKTHTVHQEMEFESRQNEVFAASSSPESPSPQMPALQLRRAVSQSSDLTAKVPRMEMECPQLDAYFSEPRSRLQYNSSPVDDTKGREGSVSSTAALKRISTDSAISVETTAGSPRSDAELENPEPATRAREQAQSGYTREPLQAIYVSQHSSGSKNHSGGDRGRALVHAATFRRGGLQCRRCETVLPDMLALERHNLQAHAMFTCSICTTTFTARNNLKRHVRMHSGVKPFKCGTCGAAFSRKDDLRTHELRHAYGRPERRQQSYTCPFCPFTGSASVVLRKHLLKHAAREEFPCPPCGLTFNDPFVYTSHVKSHSSDPNFDHYLCCFCPQRLHTYEQFVKHEKTHAKHHAHPDECPVCSKRFRTAGHLREHLASHRQPQSTENHPIAVPDERVESAEMPELQKQTAADQHGDQDNCQQQYNDEEEEGEAGLGRHQPYWCTECHVGFQDEGSFGQHIADTHEATGRRHSDKDMIRQQLDEGDSLEDQRKRMETQNPPDMHGNCGESDGNQEELKGREGRRSADNVREERHQANEGEEAGEERSGGSGDLLKSRSARQESLGHSDPDTRLPDARSPSASSTSSSSSTQFTGKPQTTPLIKVPLPLSPNHDLPVNGRVSQNSDTSGPDVAATTPTPTIRLVKPHDFIITSDSYPTSIPSSIADVKFSQGYTFLSSTSKSDRPLERHSAMSNGHRRLYVDNFLENPKDHTVSPFSGHYRTNGTHLPGPQRQAGTIL